ncbi:conserved Plasmodium protein, unknown function [Plasmodium gallinaceum]|uniref:Uncharacterized protein n=1 Tax=Plasmodium gallinaceum TaxID=5849 RepID=A0A1J1GTA9_PLAGA|nr:conserved Plasmodium protein, unknown function [Plasmodium gallinaceum]CRG95748.1 conserved Plasmodium protein, unknown function [Plasmodium gallinaceum]
MLKEEIEEKNNSFCYLNVSDDIYELVKNYGGKKKNDNITDSNLKEGYKKKNDNITDSNLTEGYKKKCILKSNKNDQNDNKKKIIKCNFLSENDKLYILENLKKINLTKNSNFENITKKSNLFRCHSFCVDKMENINIIKRNEMSKNEKITLKQKNTKLNEKKETFIKEKKITNEKIQNLTKENRNDNVKKDLKEISKKNSDNANKEFNLKSFYHKNSKTQLTYNRINKNSNKLNFYINKKYTNILNENKKDVLNKNEMYCDGEILKETKKNIRSENYSLNGISNNQKNSEAKIISKKNAPLNERTISNYETKKRDNIKMNKTKKENSEKSTLNLECFSDFQKKINNNYDYSKLGLGNNLLLKDKYKKNECLFLSEKMNSSNLFNNYCSLNNSLKLTVSSSSNIISSISSYDKKIRNVSENIKKDTLQGEKTKKNFLHSKCEHRKYIKESCGDCKERKIKRKDKIKKIDKKEKENIQKTKKCEKEKKNNKIINYNNNNNINDYNLKNIHKKNSVSNISFISKKSESNKNCSSINICKQKKRIVEINIIYHIIRYKKMLKKIKKDILTTIKNITEENKVKLPEYFNTKKYFMKFLKKLKQFLKKKIDEIKRLNTFEKKNSIYEIFLSDKKNTLLLKKYLKKKKILSKYLNRYISKKNSSNYNFNCSSEKLANLNYYQNLIKLKKTLLMKSKTNKLFNKINEKNNIKDNNNKLLKFENKHFTKKNKDRIKKNSNECKKENCKIFDIYEEKKIFPKDIIHEENYNEKYYGDFNKNKIDYKNIPISPLYLTKDNNNYSNSLSNSRKIESSNSLSILNGKQNINSNDVTTLEDIRRNDIVKRKISKVKNEIKENINLINEVNNKLNNEIKENNDLINEFNNNLKNDIKEDNRFKNIIKEGKNLKNEIKKDNLKNDVKDNRLKNEVKKNNYPKNEIGENIVLKNEIGEDIILKNEIEEGIILKNEIEEGIILKNEIKENNYLENNTKENTKLKNTMTENRIKGDSKLRNVSMENNVHINYLEEMNKNKINKKMNENINKTFNDTLKMSIYDKSFNNFISNYNRILHFKKCNNYYQNSSRKTYNSIINFSNVDNIKINIINQNFQNLLQNSFYINENEKKYNNSCKIKVYKKNESRNCNDENILNTKIRIIKNNKKFLCDNESFYENNLHKVKLIKGDEYNIVNNIKKKIYRNYNSAVFFFKKQLYKTNLLIHKNKRNFFKNKYLYNFQQKIRYPFDNLRKVKVPLFFSYNKINNFNNNNQNEKKHQNLNELYCNENNLNEKEKINSHKMTKYQVKRKMFRRRKKR